MVEQLVDQPCDEAAVLAVDFDRKTNIFFRQQHDGGFEPENRTAVPDKLGAAVIPNLPAERIGVELRLDRVEFRRQRIVFLEHDRRPHLLVRGLAK